MRKQSKMDLQNSNNSLSPSMLCVRLLKGIDLAPPSTDIYCTVTLDHVTKTSLICSPSSPTTTNWELNEALNLPLPPSQDDDESLQVDIQVFIPSQLPITPPKGRVRIPLHRLKRESVQQWYALENSKAALLVRFEFGESVKENVVVLTSSKKGGEEKVATNAAKEPRGESVTEEEKGTRRDSTASNSGGGAPVEYPSGLADYFVVAGAPATARQDRLRMLMKPRKKMTIAALSAGSVVITPMSVQQPVVDEFSQAVVVGPDSVTLSPVILNRYPPEDRLDVEFPTKCEMFLLPDGVEILRSLPRTHQEARFYTFVLVTNGVSTYGFCMEVFEALPRINLATDYEDLYAPMVLCYLSRVPLPAADFRWILQKTYDAMKQCRAENVVQNVVRWIPVPLPGTYHVSLDLFSTDQRTIRLAGLSDLPPLVFPGLCEHIFEWFPLDSIIDLWIATLLERRILIHSHNREVLAMISETLVRLMYPFKWENAYIPVLPTSLMQLFDAPIPCIFGLRTDAIKHIPGGGHEALDENWVVVDADKCTVVAPAHDPIPTLSTTLRRRLFRTIRVALANRKLSVGKRDRLIRLAFLECLASMLQGYRECFFVLSTDVDASTVFNKSQFFLRQSSQRAQNMAISSTKDDDVEDGRDFLDRFFDTTAFERFKVSQYDVETDFFHSVFAVRRARERERDQRQATLAALQGEAEQASSGGAMGVVASSGGAMGVVASSQSSQQSVVTTTTVVKTWSARESRWGYSGLEPIDPRIVAISSTTSVPATSTLLNAASTVKVAFNPPPVPAIPAVWQIISKVEPGERVRCGVFGTGVILEPIRMEDRIVTVQFDGWGAIGYVPLGSLTFCEGEDAQASDGLSSASFHLKPSKFATHAMLIGWGIQPPESVLSSYEGQTLKKSLAYYRRVLGAVAAPESSSRESHAKKSISKSAQDSKVERAMSRAITNIFSDKNVPENDLKECAVNLTNSQFARNMLVYVLKSQQSHRSTHESTWLATPGRGRRLGQQAFLSLAELVDSLLKACFAKEDFSNGRWALEVSQFYYYEDETLQMKLRGHVLWSKLMFWEFAFAEEFAVARAAAAAVALIGGGTVPIAATDAPVSLPSPDQASDAPIESPAAAIVRFHDMGAMKETEDPEEYKRKLFEHLSFFLHTMLNLDVSEDMARFFVDRIGTVFGLDSFGLDSDQKQTLNMLITNISRAASYHMEEERAQQALMEKDKESGGSPGSPTAGSKRTIKKRFGSTANVTFGNFTLWKGLRSATTAASSAASTVASNAAASVGSKSPGNSRRDSAETN